jgi:hypothetical protein
VIGADVIDAVEALHREVDRLVAEILPSFGASLRCRRGCTDCCTDDLTVFEVEAALVRERLPSSAHGTLHPPGRCAFLDDCGACAVYDLRPYVCRTQGLPLRWLDEDDAGGIVERRDVCPLNDDGVSLLDLPADRCWTIGPFEARLAQLQASVDGGALRRVSLRELAISVLRS